MVLESLVSIKEAIRKPSSMFFLGIIDSVVCMVISYFIFEQSTGMFTVFLITISMTPFINRLLRYIEAKEEKVITTEDYFDFSFWERHKRVIQIYVFFFSGMIVAMSLTYVLLPQHKIEKLFYDQINEINIIRGKFVFADKFTEIVTNNISVLALSFLFSFIFGSGAVFILAWNASVLAAAIGIAAKSFGGVKGIPLAVLMFFPHGSLEILAYFIGGIAGGIASAAFVRRKSIRFWYIVRDSLKLLVVGVVLLIVAGIIETLALVA
ncbi:MAG: stage II sporulation protein M [Candidatus Aenigmarchaeota archaeon]|nr:stage II sporulation protein M [Candidatus Aenigmarchaeota archaeon]